jgi:hypothetical protein
MRTPVRSARQFNTPEDASAALAACAPPAPAGGKRVSAEARVDAAFVTDY